MKTNEENFWEYFQKTESDLINAYHAANSIAIKKHFNKLNHYLQKIDDKLEITFHFRNNAINTFILNVRNFNKISDKIYNFWETAPKLEKWDYQVGLETYDESTRQLHLYYPKLGLNLTSNRVYVHIRHIFKSTNKLHLFIYLDLDQKKIPKEELKSLARNFLHVYLGDKYFFNHISRVKVVRRKFGNMNFMHLNELKKVIEFKD